jgi:Ca2+-binding RTX toxin-like protein
MSVTKNALQFRLFEAGQNDAWSAAPGGGHANFAVQPPTQAALVDNGGPQFVGDAIGDDISTGTSISVGGTLNSLIDHSGDLDFISVQLVAGQSYTFSLDGGSLFDSYLELRDSTGAIIATNDDGGIFLDSLLMYNSAAYTGTYYIVARGFDGGSTGTYSLTVDDIITGQTSPTTFNPNSLPFFSWEEAAIQISRSGASWASSFGTGAVVTYAYRSTAPGTMPDDTAGFSQFSAAQITSAELALAYWSSVANISFVRVDDGAGYSNNASILFGNYATGAEGAAAFAFLPSSGDTAAGDVEGDVWVNISQSDNQNPLIGTYGFQTILHEIGHALGLSHPGDYNAGEGDPITYPESADFYGDTRMFTVMSYFASSLTQGNYSQYASLPAVFDVAAIQRLYGANTSTRSGDTTYGFNSNTGISAFTLISASSQAVFNVWDGGGNDTLDFSLYTQAGMIDLREESFSSVGPRTGGTQLAHFNVSISHGVVIENAIGGSGDDIIIGNSANNFIDGRGGGDIMSGGLGDDTYVVNHFADVVNESASAGTDTVQAAATYTLGANVENLTLTGISAINGTGNASNNVITGNDQVNTLSGGDGDDTLNGAGGADILQGGNNNDTLDGGAGADNMQGGDGNDTYVVDDALDVTTESAGQGTDTVQASLTRTLGADLENLTLTGSANIDGTGNSANNIITGNTGANTLSGLDGNDTISGGDGADIIIGGLGVDTLSGGNGNDGFAYTIGDGNGSVNGGADTDSFVVSDVAGAGSILNANWNGSVLTAVAGNSLTSVESVSANMGDGVDWLIYNTSSNVVVNLTTTAATGFASVSNIERVVGGSGADTLTGDNLDNRLDGSSGDDTLAGGGGVDTLIGGDGADSLSGGLANDSITGGNGNDNISWSTGQGRDTIDGGADFDTFNATGAGTAELGNATWNGSALTALLDNGVFNIEAVNLDLGGGVDWLIYNASAAVVVNLATNSASGFASVSNIEKVIGGSGNDTLTGDTLNNRLDGLGGADTLDGGAGSDAVLGGDGNDIISASAGNDSLQGQNGDDTFNWTSTDGRDTFNGGADTDTVNLTGSGVADVADTNWNGSVITGLLNNALVDIETVNLDLGAGGTGGDWLRYNSTVGIAVDLGAGTATGFASIAGVENLIGGTGGDSLTGDGGVNKINGNNGDDVITGGGGNDNLTGGVGNDTFVYAAGAGNDTIIDFDAWDVGGQDFLDVAAFGINAGNFAARVAIIDTGADTVVRIDNTYFITLKNVSGDGDNVITDTDFLFGP